ncbi:hypothetical protein ACN27F_14755 [Solwaraspora sp. WMMB335]|uniref:hypothetical protein n=1 Tax=Solwaraspora sp. WMMB335 TaxID=3404118 RepID=UPI003B956AA6
MTSTSTRTRAVPTAPPVMRVDACSVAAPGQPDNEDQMFQYGGLVGVLDGATAPAGFETGCVHGPAWYVRRLAARLGLAAAPASTASTASSVSTSARPMSAVPLTDILSDAIRAVRDDHGGSCDLDHPGIPSATVCLLRQVGGHLDYLVLGDSPLLFDADGQVGVVADDRLVAAMSKLWGGPRPPGPPAADPAAADEQYRRAVRWQRQHTNQPDGYWIAAADPAAAAKALCGTLPLTGPGRIRRAALLSDGATRAVEEFDLVDWPGLLDLLTRVGPAELIRRVRVAERDSDNRDQPPRYKRHDDATAILCQFDDG